MYNIAFLLKTEKAPLGLFQFFRYFPCSRWLSNPSSHHFLTFLSAVDCGIPSEAVYCVYGLEIVVDVFLYLVFSICYVEKSAECRPVARD